MRTLLIRHARTAGNTERRYIGRTDAPLSEEGRAELECAGNDLSVRRVFVSPLIRARETAAVLFPRAEQIVLPGLRETDFGSFEGKNASELAEDPDYRAWVDGWCLGPCPGGESRDDVTVRAVEAFREAFRLARQEEPHDQFPLVFVTHGGVIMALLAALAIPPQDFYAYNAPNLGGWEAECVIEEGCPVLKEPSRICFIES